MFIKINLKLKFDSYFIAKMSNFNVLSDTALEATALDLDKNK
jgi:hypothetical protein